MHRVLLSSLLTAAVLTPAWGGDRAPEAAQGLPVVEPEEPTPPEAGNTAAAPCPLGAEESGWLRRILDAWSRVTGEILHVSPEPLPWIVTFDGSCLWYLASPPGVGGSAEPVDTALVFEGKPVPALAESHDGTVALPNGSEVPARGMAFASIRESDETPFLVLAMKSVWLADHPEARTLDLDDFFVGVAIHEMVHTRQLAEAGRRIEGLEGQCEIPESVTDTAIEERFADDPAFGTALRRERDLLLEAAAASDSGERRRLAAEALRQLRNRRERFFTDDARCYGEVEDLLLALEGTAIWAHFRLASTAPDVSFLPRHPEAKERDEVLAILRNRESGEWMQDASFALFLLLDELEPGWPDRMLGSKLASPVDILEDALDPGD